MVYSHVRARRVVDAVGKRISQQGDMPIRVSRATMRVLMTALGVGEWELGCDEYREIDALALDVLRHLAWQRLPA